VRVSPRCAAARGRRSPPPCSRGVWHQDAQVTLGNVGNGAREPEKGLRDQRVEGGKVKKVRAGALVLQERKARRHCLGDLGVPSSGAYVAARGPAITRVAPTVLRLNIGPEDLAAFLRAQCCTVVASFPCYSACGPAARQGRLRTLRGLRALLGAPRDVVLVREHHGGDGTAARWSRSPFSSARPPFAASPSVACVSRRRAHCGCGATGHRPRAAAHLGDNLTIETW